MRRLEAIENLPFLKDQFLERHRIGRKDLQHAAAQVSDGNRSPERLPDGRDDRFGHFVTAGNLGVTASGHQLVDDRADFLDARFLLGG